MPKKRGPYLSYFSAPAGDPPRTSKWRLDTSSYNSSNSANLTTENGQIMDELEGCKGFSPDNEDVTVVDSHWFVNGELVDELEGCEGFSSDNEDEDVDSHWDMYADDENSENELEFEGILLTIISGRIDHINHSRSSFYTTGPVAK